MALNIDQLRQYTGSGSLSISSPANQGAAQITKTGFFHALGSRLGIKSSVDQNVQTLNALRDAIQADPRYFAANVQQRATDLLNGVRTDRAIGVAQVKSIIKELDRMSNVGDRALAARDMVGGHLATRGIPAFAAQFPEKYASMAKEHIVSPKTEPQGGWGTLDIDAKLDEFEQRMQEVVNEIGNQPGDMEVFASCVKSNMLRNFDGGLKSQDKLIAMAKDLRHALDESRALGTKYGEATRVLVADSLRGLSKPFAKNTTTTLVETGRAMDKHGIDALNAGSSVLDMHRALGAFSQDLKPPAGLALDSADEVLPAQMIMVRSAVESLSSEAKTNLLAALESEDGRNLVEFYRDNSMGNKLFGNLCSTVDMVVEQLKTSLGRDNPSEPLAPPAAKDSSRLPPEVVGGPKLAGLLSGPAAGCLYPLIDAYATKTHSTTPVDDIHNSMQAIAKSAVVTNINQQIGEKLVHAEKNEGGKVVSKTFTPDRMGDIPFDLDLARTMSIHLPDGTRLQNGPDHLMAARDKLVQLVSGDPKATFSGADKAMKTKVLVLMSCLNQAMGGIAFISFGVALDPKGKIPQTAPQANLSKPRTIRFDISRDDNGNITITNTGHEFLTSISSPSGVTMVGDDSYYEYRLDITFTKENLDALGSADWTKYDHAPVIAMQGQGGEVAAANSIPDEFKFTGNVDFSIHYHLQ